MSRINLVTTDDYSVDAEETEGVVFLHCDVDEFSKSVLKDIRDSFEIICCEFRKFGYDCLFSITPNRRFIKALGQPFKVLDEVEHNGEIHEVVVWDLD